jgi:chaperonin cofactor prefoldin
MPTPRKSPKASAPKVDRIEAMIADKTALAQKVQQTLQEQQAQIMKLNAEFNEIVGAINALKELQAAQSPTQTIKPL